jgi:uncharacterized membrane protein
MNTRRGLLIIMLLLVLCNVSAQCAMCRSVAESGTKNGQTVAAGLNYGILYLMVIPYLLLLLFFRKKIWSFLKQIRSNKVE